MAQYGGLGAVSVDGQIVQAEESSGLVNASATFVVGKQLATLRRSSSPSHSIVTKLIVGERQIE